MNILTDVALINSGFALQDSNVFSNRIYNTLNAQLGLGKNPELNNFEVDLTEVE